MDNFSRDFLYLLNMMHAINKFFNLQNEFMRRVTTLFRCMYDIPKHENKDSKLFNNYLMITRKLPEQKVLDG